MRPQYIESHGRRIRVEVVNPDPPKPRPKAAAGSTFARIPHDKALELYRHRISGAAWTVLIEIDRLVFRAHGRNPLKLSSARLRKIGLTDHTRQRALRELEAAGVIKVVQRGNGRSPLVTFLWRPLQN